MSSGIRNVISDNIVNNASDTGITIGSDSFDNTIMNNSLTLCTPAGISLQDSGRNRILGNTISNGGIEAYVDSEGRDGFIGNMIRNMSANGFELRGATRMMFLWNRIQDNSGNGIRLTE